MTASALCRALLVAVAAASLIACERPAGERRGAAQDTARTGRVTSADSPATAGASVESSGAAHPVALRTEGVPSGYVRLDSASADFTGDGVREQIGLYVRAEATADGRVLWEDGHQWLLLVRTSDGNYALLDRFVPWGRLRFWLVEENRGGVAVVVEAESSTGGVQVESYRYEPRRAEFVPGHRVAVTGQLVHRTDPAVYR